MRLSIRTSLVTLFVVMIGLSLGSLLLQYREIRLADAAMERLLASRLEPATRLKAVSDLYAINIVDASHKAQNGNWGFADGARSVREASAGIATNWVAYRASLTDAAERNEATETAQRMVGVDRSVARLQAILEREDIPGLRAFIRDELYQSIDPLTERIGVVLDGLVAAARAEVAAETKALERSVDLLAGLCALTLALGSVGLWLVLVRVAAPIGRITAAMRRIAEGDLETPIPDRGRTDEIGAMARALLVFHEHAMGRVALLAEQERLHGAADASRSAALNRMADRVEGETSRAVEAIAKRAGDLDRNAAALTADAAQMADETQAAGHATAEALGASQTVASAAEELAASIREIGAQVGRANEVVRATSAKADGAEAAIASLAEAVQRIGTVAGLIGDVAGQTNLLALNATIEAARAGEAGKGFAVVAAEVKNLANQTARSTEEIASQIGAIEAATDGAVKVVRAMAADIRAIDAISASIATSVEQQGAATGEIARSVQAAAHASETVAKAMQRVTTGVGSTQARGVEVRGAATDVAASIVALREALVRVVRTATDEVDRRQERRIAMRRPARIEAGGRTVDVELLDLSVGGARVSGWTGAGAGAVVVLGLAGVGGPLPGRVIDANADAVRIGFALEPAMRASLERYLAAAAA